MTLSLELKRSAHLTRVSNPFSAKQPAVQHMAMLVQPGWQAETANTAVKNHLPYNWQSRSAYPPENEFVHHPADHKGCCDTQLAPPLRAPPIHISILHQAALHDWIIYLHAKGRTLKPNDLLGS